MTKIKRRPINPVWSRRLHGLGRIRTVGWGLSESTPCKSILYLEAVGEIQKVTTKSNDGSTEGKWHEEVKDYVPRIIICIGLLTFAHLLAGCYLLLHSHCGLVSSDSEESLGGIDVPETYRIESDAVEGRVGQSGAAPVLCQHERHCPSRVERVRSRPCTHKRLILRGVR